MSSTDAISGTNAVSSFVTKIYDTRDSNEDGTVSAKEQAVYDSKHESARAVSPVKPSDVSEKAENASSGPEKTLGRSLDVSA